MTTEASQTGDRDPDSFHHRLVRYFHDCLAAQSDWGRALNVIDQTDVTLLPLTAAEQDKLGAKGTLRLSDQPAIELGKKVLTGGSEVSLQLGALFLVGRIPAGPNQSERRFCGPLLEVALSLRHEADGYVVISPEETEFSVNYSMLAELLGSEDDELQDRLEDLAELVPDFPIDASEFDTFWRGFRMIAPELVIDENLPNARKTEPPSRFSELPHDDDSGEPPQDNRQPARQTRKLSSEASLELIDFFTPAMPSDGIRMLPATAVVLGPKAGRSMSALAELRRMEHATLTDTAFGCLFDPHGEKQPVYAKSDRAYPDEVLPLPLSPAQAAVVESARSAPLTVVTGPPGTGKSHTITAIALDAMMHGQTVLIASQMDKAVEVVADRLEDLLDATAIARSGGRAAQRQLADKISNLTGPRKHREECSTQTIDETSRHHYELTRQLQDSEQRFQEMIASERDWSRAKHAYDRAQRPNWLASIKLSDAALDRADRILGRLRAAEATDAGLVRRWFNAWNANRLRRLLEIPSGYDASLNELERLGNLHRLRREMRDLEQQLGQSPTSDAIFDELSQIERQRRSTGLELLRQTRSKELRSITNVAAQRSQLRDLATLLRRRKHELKQQLQEGIAAEVLLRAFPIWACTSRSLCEVLPAKPALFDLVVIDEASQCDLALASVALLRAKRVVVVGDPHQLRHVCFLSRAREQASLAHCQIPAELQDRFSYRRSLFDVAADMVDRRHFFFLDEHFRSHPQIIEFSNRRFYNCDLSIMTRRPSATAEKVIQVHQVAGRRTPESTVNQTEIETIIASIRSIVSAAPTQAGSPSIGVVSPFRDQVDAIREQLAQAFPAEPIARHAMVVGTAHAFQGDEKDLVFVSTSIDGDSHPASLRFLESPNLFNVAITRARKQLVIVTSVRPDQLPPGLLRDYLFHANQDGKASPETQPPRHRWESMILEHLAAHDLPAWPGFQGAGQRIDVATEIDGRSTAILCDHWDESNTPEWKTLEHHRRLARAGWHVIRVSHRCLEANDDQWLRDRLLSSSTTNL